MGCQPSSLHDYFHGLVVITLHLEVGDPAVSLGRSDAPTYYQSQFIKDIFQEIINAITEAMTMVTPKAIPEKSCMEPSRTEVGVLFLHGGTGAGVPYLILLLLVLEVRARIAPAPEVYNYHRKALFDLCGHLEQVQYIQLRNTAWHLSWWGLTWFT